VPLYVTPADVSKPAKAGDVLLVVAAFRLTQNPNE